MRACGVRGVTLRSRARAENRRDARREEADRDPQSAIRFQRTSRRRMIRALGVGTLERVARRPNRRRRVAGRNPTGLRARSAKFERRPNPRYPRARRETAASGRVRTCTRRRRRSTSRSTESAACSKCPRGRACVVPSAVARERRTTRTSQRFSRGPNFKPRIRPQPLQSSRETTGVLTKCSYD